MSNYSTPSIPPPPLPPVLPSPSPVFSAYPEHNRAVKFDSDTGPLFPALLLSISLSSLYHSFPPSCSLSLSLYSVSISLSLPLALFLYLYIQSLSLFPLLSLSVFSSFYIFSYLTRFQSISPFLKFVSSNVPNSLSIILSFYILQCFSFPFLLFNFSCSISPFSVSAILYRSLYLFPILLYHSLHLLPSISPLLLFFLSVCLSHCRHTARTNLFPFRMRH